MRSPGKTTNLGDLLPTRPLDTQVTHMDDSSEAAEPPETPALRGFAVQADRRSIARAKGGTYEGVVQEKDDFSWEPRRWALRPARLLYVYEPTRNEPCAIYDVDAFQRVDGPLAVAFEASDGGNAVRARFRDEAELARFQSGLVDADCTEWRQQADTYAARAASYEALAAAHRRRFVEAEAARDAAAQDVRLESERADELEQALHAARSDGAPRSSTRARPREAARAIQRARANVSDDAHAAAAASTARVADAETRIRAAHAERDAWRGRCDQADARRAEVEAALADRTVNGTGGEELQRRKAERKVLVRAVKELRRRVRKLRDADRKADAVSAYWGPGAAADPVDAPAPPNDRGADWIEEYLRSMNLSDSEDDERPPPSPPPIARDEDAFDAAASVARDTAAAAARFVRARLPVATGDSREPRVEVI